MNANPLPSFLFDLKSLNYIEINDAAVGKYGYSRIEFKKMKITDIRPPEDVPKLLEHYSRPHPKLENAGKWRHRLKNGKVIEVEVVTHPIKWNKRNAVIAVATDISERREIETALKGAEEKLSAIIANAPIIIWAVDTEGRVTMSDGKALRALGYKPGELIGKSVYEMYHNEPEILANTRRAMSGESFVSINEVAGTLLESRFAPRHDENGNFCGYIGVSTDITDRKRSDRLLRQQSAAMRAAMDGMAIFNDKEEFIFLNEAHIKIYGYASADELTGKTWRVLYAPDELKRFKEEIMPVFWKQGFWHGEAVGKRKDGSAFPQEISLSRIDDGGLVCVVRDITERREIEQERGRLLALEKTARTSAEAAGRAKDEFLAVVSHELRTPMTAVLGWTCLLRTGELNAADQQRALDVIERNMRLQAQIIEDLLDISSIITGKLHLETRPVELGSMLKSAVDSVRTAAEIKGVHIEIEGNGPILIQGDRFRLRQVFWNLLSNAVKFNHSGGHVKVHIGQEEGQAIVKIEDDGRGISSEFLPGIFQLFRQGEDSLTRQHRGLGIGLAIVKHLVEAHKGKVAAFSHGMGRGTTFTVSLPICVSAETETEEPSANENNPNLLRTKISQLSQSLNDLSILIVDDEIDTLQMLAEILKYCGATVLSASSASEALKIFLQHQPEIVISDLAMPDEDGYSLIRKIITLSSKNSSKVAAIALTACAKEEDKERALAAGYHLHMTKPVEPDDLISAIRSLADRSRRRS